MMAYCSSGLWLCSCSGAYVHVPWPLNSTGARPFTANSRCSVWLRRAALAGIRRSQLVLRRSRYLAARWSAGLAVLLPRVAPEVVCALRAAPVSAHQSRHGRPDHPRAPARYLLKVGSPSRCRKASACTSGCAAERSCPKGLWLAGSSALRRRPHSLELPSATSVLSGPMPP
jgi:hypothetical protein